MSVRFFKIFFIIFFVHMLAFRYLWVGFPAPYARDGAVFVYQGALPLGLGNNSPAPAALKLSGRLYPIALEGFEASSFNHWIELRAPSKP